MKLSLYQQCCLEDCIGRKTVKDLYIDGAHRVIRSSKEMGTTYRKPFSNKSCGVLFLLRMEKLQETVSCILNRNFLESIRDLCLQDKK